TGNISNQAFNVTSDNVTLNLFARTYFTTALTGNAIGTSNFVAGRLIITNGTVSMAANSDLRLGTVSNQFGKSAGFLTVSSTTGRLVGGTNGGTGTMYIGSVGDGTLTVSNGGFVQSDAAILGDALGAVGTATVFGAPQTIHSNWVSTSFILVGASGKGTL